MSEYVTLVVVGIVLICGNMLFFLTNNKLINAEWKFVTHQF